MNPEPETPWYLTGPTASGKTAVGIELARLLNAEIISLDSMAVYRGMDIGTAKPTPAERAAIPHHLIDVVEPSENYSVAEYRQAAMAAIEAIKRRGREVLFVGGTPLYLKAMLRGIFAGPPADWNLRRRLMDESRADPSVLYRQLQLVDPVAAARLHANDTRRLIRALEVFEATGSPISALQQQFEVGRAADECHVFVLHWPRGALNERINRRVESMFATGLVEETRRLIEREKPLGRTAWQAVGYREVIEHLEGKLDLAATIELVKLRTRQFAKRQLTWFRSLSECRSVPVAEPFDATLVAQRIFELGRAM
ncbi:MAG: tRNA (adenosine(37)-N6)-dimethylallyltransferase MiaA [Pirellulales bacterium]